jgi:hypothetical protein
LTAAGAGREVVPAGCGEAAAVVDVAAGEGAIRAVEAAAEPGAEPVVEPAVAAAAVAAAAGADDEFMTVDAAEGSAAAGVEPSEQAAREATTAIRRAPDSGTAAPCRCRLIMCATFSTV